MAIQTTTGLILRRWNFRETSLILSVLTASSGRFHGLIKGYYRQPPRYGPALVGSLNTVVFYESRRQQLALIAQCDLFEPLLSLSNDMGILQTQSRFLELMERGTAEHDPHHPQLLDLAVQALRSLETATDTLALMRLFEAKWLKLLGLSPAVDDCVSCNAHGDPRALLSLKHGGLLCPACAAKDPLARPLLPGTLATLRHLLTQSWETGLRLTYTRPVWEELDRWLDRFIAFHVEAKFHTRRPPVPELAYAKN